MSQNFTDLGLRPEIIKAITDMGFKTPTPIQAKTIPFLINGTGDLVAFAQTGTGKTGGFGLPILHRIDSGNKSTQYLVLSPTRELCLQISNDLKNFAQYLPGIKIVEVYGGAPIDKQIRELGRGAHIIVGTPGRLRDLISRRKVNLTSLLGLILDEADEMLAMGFRDELDEILTTIPAERQTLMFSATMAPEIKQIANQYLDNAEELAVARVNTVNNSVHHAYHAVSVRDRYEALRRVCDANPDIYGIIFCRTRREAKDVAEKLMNDHYNADALHGDLSQSQRDEVMRRFRQKNLQILVATDVAARGLDVDNLTHVIHFSLPDDPEVYTHRSGRTGRAGNTGISISIVPPRDEKKIRLFQVKIGRNITPEPIPTGAEICKNQLFSLINKLEQIEVNKEQIQPFLPEIYDKLMQFDRETLIQKMVSVEFNRFLQTYKNAPDINKKASRNDRERESDDKRSNRKNIRYETVCIDLGKVDGVNPKSLITLVNQATDSGDITIGSINIDRSKTYFDIEQGREADVVQALQKWPDFPIKAQVVPFHPRRSKPPRSGRPGNGPRRSGVPRSGGRRNDSRSGGRPRGRR